MQSTITRNTNTRTAEQIALWKAHRARRAGMHEACDLVRMLRYTLRCNDAGYEVLRRVYQRLAERLEAEYASYYLVASQLQDPGYAIRDAGWERKVRTLLDPGTDQAWYTGDNAAMLEDDSCNPYGVSVNDVY